MRASASSSEVEVEPEICHVNVDDNNDDIVDWSPLPGYYSYAAPTAPQVTNSGSSSSEDDDDEESDEERSYSADDSDLTSDTDEDEGDYSWFADTPVLKRRIPRPGIYAGAPAEAPAAASW